jgi:hypothetical protein
VKECGERRHAVGAGVSTYQGPPNLINEGVRYAQENIVRRVEKVEGFEGVYFLVDRQAARRFL